MANKTIVDLETNLVKPYIDTKAITIEKNLAPTETGATAVGSYAIGEQFVRGDKLYKAKTAITAGDTLTLNTNYELADDITTQVTSLKEDFISHVNANGSKNILPTDIKTLMELNTAGTWNSNAYTHNGVTFTVNDDMSIIISGTSGSSASAFIITPYFSINSNIDFMLSEGSKTDVPALFLQENGTPIVVVNIPTASEISFNFNTKKTVSARLYINANTTYSGTVYPMICLKSDFDLDSNYCIPTKTNRQLTEDSVDWNDLSELGAVNFLENTAVTQTITTGGANITFTVNADGSVTVNGTTGTDTIRLSLCTANALLDLIKRHGILKMSGCPSGGGASTYNIYCNLDSLYPFDYGDGKIIQGNSGSTSSTGITIQIAGGQTANNLTFYPMLTPVSYNGDYVPYAKTNKELTELAEVSRKDYISTTYGIGFALAKVGRVITAQVIGEVVQAIAKNTTVYTLPEEARPFNCGLFFWVADQNTIDNSSDGSVQLLTKGYINTNGTVSTGAIANGAKARSQIFSYIAANDTPLS